MQLYQCVKSAYVGQLSGNGHLSLQCKFILFTELLSKIRLDEKFLYDIDTSVHICMLPLSCHSPRGSMVHLNIIQLIIHQTYNF